VSAQVEASVSRIPKSPLVRLLLGDGGGDVERMESEKKGNPPSALGSTAGIPEPLRVFHYGNLVSRRAEVAVFLDPVAGGFDLRRGQSPAFFNRTGG
jgi:hypothetical protein